MAKIVECVPNFSEGRRKDVIDTIASAIKATDGCTLIDVDPGASTNRTVVTFVGSPDAVVNGAFNAAKMAKELIDMRTHTGEHPRFGAMDVCPFIPVSGVTMDDCVKCAERFGKRAGEELGLPMYLYEYAAKADYRRLLPQVRQGEYEGIAGRITQPEWKPDFGPAEFVPTWGATATGARKFLVAYNVNLLSTKNQAHRIALNIREQGRGPDELGKLKAVKGIGWYVDEYNMAQVSVNCVDIDVTPMHIVFEECVKEAKALNVPVTGSEIVGVVPLKSMLDAADYYCEKENLFVLDEQQKVRLVIERLGLNSIIPFIPEKRIVEYVIRDRKADEPLASLSVREFVEELGARSSAPGGGSASSLSAALGAALGGMAAWLTYGYRKYEALDPLMRKSIPLLYTTMEALIPQIDADTVAFNDYVAAVRLPKGTDDEQAARTNAMQKALQTAIAVPLKTMELGDQCWSSLLDIVDHFHWGCKSDMQVGVKSLHTGIWGAYQNVLINMNDITNEQWKATTLEKAEAIMKRADESQAEILRRVEERKE